MRPSITRRRICAAEGLSDPAIEIHLNDEEANPQSDLSRIQSIKKKFEPLRAYLHFTNSPEDKAGFNILTGAPTVAFQPDVEYHLIKLNSEQLDVAKELAPLHTAGHTPEPNRPTPSCTIT